MKKGNLYLSNNKINTFNICAKKYEIKYKEKSLTSNTIKNEYFIFNNLIHNIIADMNRLPDITTLTSEQIQRIIDTHWKKVEFPSLKTDRFFYNRALKIFNLYKANPKDVGIDNIVIDKYFRYQLTPDTHISALIDKIYERRDGYLEVIDYKTGSYISTKLNFKNNYQLPLYLLLSYNHLGIYPEFISYYYLLWNKKLTYKVTSADIASAEKILINQCDTIRDTKFYCSNYSAMCRDFCEYYEVCTQRKLRRKMYD